jgi:hypothetical protein
MDEKIRGTIKISIYLPEQNPQEYEDWGCLFQLELPNQTIEQTIFGIDGLQALLLTIKTIKSLIHNYSTTNALKLSWLGFDNIGFEMII